MISIWLLLSIVLISKFYLINQIDQLIFCLKLCYFTSEVFFGKVILSIKKLGQIYWLKMFLYLKDIYQISKYSQFHNFSFEKMNENNLSSIPISACTYHTFYSNFIAFEMNAKLSNFISYINKNVNVCYGFWHNVAFE